MKKNTRQNASLLTYERRSALRKSAAVRAMLMFKLSLHRRVATMIVLLGVLCVAVLASSAIRLPASTTVASAALTQRGVKSGPSGADVPVSLPNATACPGSTNVMVPVIVGDTTGQGIIGYDFTFTFNTSVIQLASPAFQTSGTLSNGWSITPNTSTPGQIRIVAFNATPLSGAGTLIFIKFNVVGSLGSNTPLTWTAFMFNEGTPAANPLTSGSLTVTPPIQISLPDTTAPPGSNNFMVPVSIGDTTGQGVLGYDFTFTFNTSVIQLANPAFQTNGTLSQGWTITPNTATPGQIRIVGFNTSPLSGSGTLIFIKFNVVGSQGSMTPLTWTNFLFNEGNPCAALTNGSLTVTGAGADVPVSLPNITGCPGASNVMVPVIVGDTTGRGIIGYDFTFSFNTSVIQLASPAFQTSGTLSDGWSITPNTSTPGQIRIVAFNATPLSGAGTLIFIKFNVVGPLGSNTPLTWINFMFNEGNPGDTLTNGSFGVIAPIPVSLPDTTAPAGANNFMVPVSIGDTTGKGILGYDFTFTFNTSVIQLANPAFQTNGTLSQGWTITPNTSTPGQIRIVGFNTTALSGSGTLIFIKFNVVGAQGSMTPLTWTNFLFNEGNPCVALTNGSLTVTPAGGNIPVSLPNATACPGSTNVMVPVIVGDTTGRGVLGYDFTFTFNNSVIQLANPAFDTSGTLSDGWNITPNTSTPGQIRIVAFNTAPLSGSGTLIFIKFNVVGGPTTPLTWTNFLFNEGDPGETLTNGSLTVNSGANAVAVSLPNTTASPGATNVMVPVIVGDTTGRGIIGYDFTFVFDTTVIQLASPSFETNGTLSQGWSITPNTATPGQIRIVAFNATPLSGSGTLIFIKFNVVGSEGDMTLLTWARFLFNEGDPCATLTNGKLTVTTPTAVKLEKFNATAFDNGVFLEWQTGFEVDNLGFNIYRMESGERTLVTPDILAGSALATGSAALTAGRTYRWWDTGSRHALYYLEDIDINGTRTLHGPITPVAMGGRPSEQSSAALLSGLGDSQSHAGLTQPVEREATSSVSGHKSLQPELASESAVKLSVKREGWYRLTQPELVAAGFDPNVNPRFLQLFVDGQQQPVKVIGEADGRFDPSDAVEFYGVGLNSAVTDTRVYWLVAGSQPGQRTEAVKGSGKQPGSGSFLYTVERKDRTIYFPALRNGEKENFFGAVIAGNLDQTLTLSHVARSDSVNATLEVALQGVTLAGHRVNVELNGDQAGVLDFEGRSQGVATFNVPHSLLREGANVVRLTPLGGPSDVTLVDYIRLSHQRYYVAENDSLKFTATGGQRITIDGFTSDSIRVIDVTDSNAPQEIIGSIGKRHAGYAITFAPPAAGERSLLAFATERRPASVSMNSPSDLQSLDADFIVITNRQLADSLKPLVALRQSQGLSVSLVDIEDIYDEFSFGQKSPFAVRDFLAFAHSNWKSKPRFVLLAGDASYDPKNYLGFGDSDLVLTRLVDTHFMETASDDWFADSDADGVADLAVGRLPVRTPEEASLLVSKLVAYESSSPSQEVLLVADANDGFDFEAANNQLASLVPPSLRVNQVNRGRVGTETAKKNLLDGISRGQRLVNYSGHGSVNQWRANLLTDADALALGNDHLPMFVMMTCLNGYFHDPAFDSLAESLMKAEHGGAVAVWASSGMTLPGAQATMNHELYRLVFSDPALALGEAARRAKLATSDIDVRRTWVLFGDPTMKLK